MFGLHLDAEKLASADQVTIAQYEEALSKLRETTKETDINDIVETFEKNEEENFALFNYVNELNHELESLTDQVTFLVTKFLWYEFMKSGTFLYPELHMQ